MLETFWSLISTILSHVLVNFSALLFSPSLTSLSQPAMKEDPVRMSRALHCYHVYLFPTKVFRGLLYDLLKLSLTDQLDAEEVADVASQLVTNLVSVCVCTFSIHLYHVTGFWQNHSISSC